MPSKEAKAAIDARVMARLKARGLTDVAVIGGTEIDGYFMRDYVTQGGGDDVVAGARVAFDCRADDLPQLFENDELEVQGYGKFRYLHTEGPDDGGRVVLVLGEILQ